MLDCIPMGHLAIYTCVYGANRIVLSRGYLGQLELEYAIMLESGDRFMD